MTINQTPEPTLYQSRMSPDQKNWSHWGECSREAAENYERITGHQGWHYEVRRLYTTAPAATVPDGYEAIAVKGLGPLIDALERAESKGYMPHAVEEYWAAFDYRSMGT